MGEEFDIDSLIGGGGGGNLIFPVLWVEIVGLTLAKLVATMVAV